MTDAGPQACPQLSDSALSQAQRFSTQPGVEPAPDQPLQPPSFSPLFALVTDTSTGTTHHPRVHYVFSDDDPDTLTAALAHHHTSLTSAEHDPDAEITTAPPAGGTSSNSGNPPERERAILLDLMPNSEGQGFYVAGASSLSSRWAVLSARLSRIDGAAGDSDEDDDRLSDQVMLRIEGVGLDAPESGRMSSLEYGELQSSTGIPSNDRPGAAGEDYTALVEEFDKRMTLMKPVTEAVVEMGQRTGSDSNAVTFKAEV